MVIAKNGQLPNAHFHKHWQRRVRTWFNQPAQKVKRRRLRKAKAEKIYPRPVGYLRPAVRAPTRKYNYKVRVGRGFTIEELKVAGVTERKARSIGIAVDRRRRNRCQESIDLNVQRLKEYLNRVVVPSKLERKSITESKEQRIKQIVVKQEFPVKSQKPAIEFHNITEDDKKFNAFHKLRMVRTMDRYAGSRAAKVAKLAEEEAAKKK